MAYPRDSTARFVTCGMVVGVLILGGCSNSPGPAAGGVSDAVTVGAGPVPSATVSVSARASRSSSAAGGSSATPKGDWVELSCILAEDATVTETFAVPVDAQGRFDFRAVWRAKAYDCDVSGVNGRPATQMTAVTAAQKAAAKAAEYDDQDIAVLVGLCGEHDAAGVYLRPSFAMSEGQAAEMTGALKLCPSHPDAAELRAAMQRGTR